MCQFSFGTSSNTTQTWSGATAALLVADDVALRERGGHLAGQRRRIGRRIQDVAGRRGGAAAEQAEGPEALAVGAQLEDRFVGEQAIFADQPEPAAEAAGAA